MPDTTTNQTLTLVVDATNAIIVQMKLVDVWLRIEFILTTGVQQFSLQVNGTFYQPFDSGL